ncbi:MAG TPA: type II toxin-antitoxin system HigB family toxin, partial [Paraburkholderia sp.]|nr:type II toxin-antitoxin system HigB family toxin [Paraburkholderia sp.]
MRIFSRSTFQAYCQDYPPAAQALNAWYAEASRADWRTPQDIKNRFASASFVSNDRVVFNIKGNEYRLIA